MDQGLICQAIKNKNIIQFYYNHPKHPGRRTVEPHMVADNEAEHRVLSAWLLHGGSESTEGQGWREYLLSEMSNIIILPDTFDRPRPYYKHDGGKKYHNVQCAL
jgi:predicted DNA-binding transcriptional regulator YafY